MKEITNRQIRIFQKGKMFFLKTKESQENNCLVSLKEEITTVSIPGKAIAEISY